MDTSDDPITIGLAVGGGLQVLSSIKQGQAAQAQGEFQAEIAARNAAERIKEAEGQRQAAAEAAIEVERQGRKDKSRIRGIQAKSGTVIGKGSNLSVLIERAQDIEDDKFTTLREGAIRASSLEAQAGILRAQGAAAKSRGKTAKRASVLSAVGTGVGTTAGIGQSRFDRGLKPFSPGKR